MTTQWLIFDVRRDWYLGYTTTGSVEGGVLGMSGQTADGKEASVGILSKPDELIAIGKELVALGEYLRNYPNATTKGGAAAGAGDRPTGSTDPPS